MSNLHWLADQFEASRSHLQAVAYRLLGSFSEAEDAVQESWFRLSRSDVSEVENITGWLTTVVSRVCLDMLRSRNARREESMESHDVELALLRKSDGNPEQEALLADSIGVALAVVLEKLNPVERVAFVLHDIFAVPFVEIAPIIGRTESAARQLASRARRRVQGVETAYGADLAVQKALVDSFLAAARTGDLDALLSVLDQDVVLRDYRTAAPDAPTSEVYGAKAVAQKVMLQRAKAARSALVNGSVGIVVAPRGQLLLVLVLSFSHDRIIGIDVIADPAHLKNLDLADLDV